MNLEIETNTEGVKSVVKRARHVEQDVAFAELYTANETSLKASTAPEEVGKKMVENKDKNSDITSQRYPNSHLDNSKDRGNM